MDGRNYVLEPLSQREVEILRLLADGLSNREIAQALVITPGTVKWYNKQIFKKLNVHSREEASTKAILVGLLENKAVISDPPIGDFNDNLHSEYPWSDKEPTNSIIQTKLNRPPLPLDLVRRPRLTKHLEQLRSRPLTLVSAPAGYGKSTMISCWLEAMDCPVAWLALDESDNDVRVFLDYFLAAIQNIFPNALPETRAMLMVTPLPPISAIAKLLINELNQIEEPFILVLDDYHMVETETIHDLLKLLLLHPPHKLHLVLGTRADPPLPLITFRAKGKVTEIRTQDLRFNQDETQELFQQMLGTSIDRADIIVMDTQTEGWVTGLRLSALAMRHRIGRDSFPGEISVQNRYVTEYLVNEILAKLTARSSDCLLKTSILERFCADLCETVCHQEAESVGIGSAGTEFSGERFLEWLKSSNLFVVPLDDQNEWFRYHHLFRYILQQELFRRLSPDEIGELHIAAGSWYADKGLIEEALNHLLGAGDTAASIEVVSQHRYRMMNADRWPRLERWLNVFPPTAVETSAELWMLKTWLVYHNGLWSELPVCLEQLATIMEVNQDQEIIDRLAGEMDTLRCLITYHTGEPNGAISYARQALENIPPEFWSLRVLARSYLGISLLASGDERCGYHAFYDAFREEQVQNRRFKATLLMAACYFHWMTADLQSMAQAARQSIAICPETGYQSILGYGKYNLARVHYLQNDLAAADELFSSVVAKPYQNYGDCYTSSACGLAMTLQAQGRESEALEVTEATIAFLLETGNTTQLPVALALQAELALIQGRLPAAIQWAKKLDPVPPLAPMMGFIVPQLTLIKVWLMQNSSDSNDKAAKSLNQWIKYLTSIHHTRFQIDILALQALLYDTTGDQPAALTSLERALRLAQPGGFIRTFVDLGPRMASLLSKIREDGDLDRFIKQIRSAYAGAQQPLATTSQEVVLGSLTNREMQVLELMRERMTNKEIAAQLVIAPGTVKAHTIRIYQKLAVKDRRQAVEKAIALRILYPA